MVLDGRLHQLRILLLLFVGFLSHRSLSYEQFMIPHQCLYDIPNITTAVDPFAPVPFYANESEVEGCEKCDVLLCKCLASIESPSDYQAYDGINSMYDIGSNNSVIDFCLRANTVALQHITREALRQIFTFNSSDTCELDAPRQIQSVKKCFHRYLQCRVVLPRAIPNMMYPALDSSGWSCTAIKSSTQESIAQYLDDRTAQARLDSALMQSCRYRTCNTLLGLLVLSNSSNYCGKIWDMNNTWVEALCMRLFPLSRTSSPTSTHSRTLSTTRTKSTTVSFTVSFSQTPTHTQSRTLSPTHSLTATPTPTPTASITPQRALPFTASTTSGFRVSTAAAINQSYWMNNLSFDALQCSYTPSGPSSVLCNNTIGILHRPLYRNDSHRTGDLIRSQFPMYMAVSFCRLVKYIAQLQFLQADLNVSTRSTETINASVYRLSSILNSSTKGLMSYTAIPDNNNINPQLEQFKVPSDGKCLCSVLVPPRKNVSPQASMWLMRPDHVLSIEIFVYLTLNSSTPVLATLDEEFNIGFNISVTSLNQTTSQLSSATLSHIADNMLITLLSYLQPSLFNFTRNRKEGGATSCGAPSAYASLGPFGMLGVLASSPQVPRPSTVPRVYLPPSKPSEVPSWLYIVALLGSLVGGAVSGVLFIVCFFPNSQAVSLEERLLAVPKLLNN